MNAHFSSATDLHGTPQWFFDQCNAEFGPFELDVAADAINAKCPRFYDRERNGLLHEWKGRVWCNPPYGRGIGEWVKKAFESAKAGAVVVCLIPARTDTAWWHDYAMRGEVRFIRGRLKFGTAQNNAPFPSALVIFNFQKTTPCPSNLNSNFSARGASQDSTRPHDRTAAA